jgi:hypothetical protein
MKMLDGKKTYITAAIVGLASFAMALGWLDKEQYQVIVGLLASLGLATLRSGVAKATTDKAKEIEQKEKVTLSGELSIAETNVGGNG